MTTLSILNIIPQFFRTLWLSVSSTAFYRDIYYMYKGYGLKYITMIISTTSIIYAILFMYNVNVVRNYLEDSTPDKELNPVEFLLKDWPALQYDGKTLAAEDPAPIYMVSQAGIKIGVIDTAGNLSKDQLQKVSLVFAKDKAILWLNTKGKDSKEEPTSIVVGYDKIFGTDSLVIDRDFIKSFLLNTVNQVGIFAFCLALPIVIVIRIGLHISSNLFSIILLYSILWGMRRKPTIQSASRIVLFASGAAEIATPFLLLISPSIVSLTTFIEYWAVLLAMYSISTNHRSTIS